MVKYSKLTYWVGIVVAVVVLLASVSSNSTTATGVSSAQDRSFPTTADHSSEIEKRIRTGELSTADLIVDDHPRLWVRGETGWNKDIVGTFAWRVIHDPDASWGNRMTDSEVRELNFILGNVDQNYANGGVQTWAMRPHWSFVLGKAFNLGWQIQNGREPQHTADEYLLESRNRLIALISRGPSDREYREIILRFGTVSYDWMFNETLSDGTPLLSEEDKTFIREGIITAADDFRERANGSEKLFNNDDIADYDYVMAGMALYEPTLEGDPGYSAINAKAKSYLDDFDTYYIGKIIPALNAQGADGGWHGGLWSGGGRAWDCHVLQSAIAHILFAHMTATNHTVENSLYSTDAMKNFVEFQAYMTAPMRRDNYNKWVYFPFGPNPYLDPNRYAWIGPLLTHSRRRFSSDSEQQKLAKLGGWILRERQRYANEGSFDMFDQLMFEEKWPYPSLSPSEIGYPTTKHFRNLGWVFMRSGFESEDDVAAVFISQRYHWSDLNPYSQNSFYLERKGDLIEGVQNSIWIDEEYQQEISDFPTIAQGPEAYAPGSDYDVGPGILDFESNDTYDYMLGDATNAYDSSKLSKFTRQVVYLKPDIFIVFDKVITTSPDIEKKWVVDPGATPQDQGNGLITVDNGSGALWIKRLLPTSASVSLSDAQIAVVPSLSGTETFFLHVMQAVDSGAGAGQVSADDATVTQEGDWFHVQVAGRKISFSRSGEFDFDGQPSTLRGDVNLDGIVDSQDIQLRINVFLAFERDPSILERADLNKDGIVNSLDVQGIFLEANR